jgi:transcriptional regulator with XRE-family HTH domain
VAGTGKGVTPRQQAFGDHVRDYRAKAGLSQEALAYEAGLNRSYVASLEAGARNPSLETIARLAIALRIDAADLVRGTQRKRGRQE